MSNIGYDQSFECMICFDKRNQFFAHILVDTTAETFNRYGIERHLQDKHTIDEILKWFSAHHHEVMTERINPTSRCNFPSSIDMGAIVRHQLNEFQKEYKLTFRKKPKVKKKKKVRSKLIKDRKKKQLKVKARITHK